MIIFTKREVRPMSYSGCGEDEFSFCYVRLETWQHVLGGDDQQPARSGEWLLGKGTSVELSTQTISKNTQE